MRTVCHKSEQPLNQKKMVGWGLGEGCWAKVSLQGLPWLSIKSSGRDTLNVTHVIKSSSGKLKGGISL